MKAKGFTVLVIIAAMCALIVPAAAQPTPSTPFLISGCVNYSNEAPVNNPTVTIENLNTSKVFTAKTNESYNYYRVLTSSNNVSTGNILHFNASNGNVKEFNHTVTEVEMNSSGGFVKGITISGIANHVVISEVYANAINNTGSEWIELYNPTDSDTVIGGWTIGTPTSSTDATIPSVTIKARSFFLVADANFSTRKDNSSWQDADYEEKITLGDSNSWIYLNDSLGNTIDTVGWGPGATKYEGSPASGPSQGKSLQRKINATITGDGYGPAWDTNNNSADFFIQTIPNPQNSGTKPVPPIPELPTLILFASGLIILAGYVVLKRMK